eukprot:gnl/Chilomastix_cuspidata/36.p1 GENE.gnl/Chilomastix_cuspidata/36~~gnl/Chilomastix_cuspidata/36.p1  ORF type:complete len:837 (+),score=287.10 gnl/Chilomastix_cuspidata/36:34-2544(+)
MPNFTVDQVRRIMDDADRIRNMSVIAHVDHGKTTLTDSLIANAGIIALGRAGDTRFMDTRPDEQERCITIKSTGVSLFYDWGRPGQEKHSYLINLIDSPGHVDFSAEVTSALRVTDGALVVVDCVEGVCVQTETVLRQALAERVKPVLMLNKVDRIILELRMNPEEAYKAFYKTVNDVNVLVDMYHDTKIGNMILDPTQGTIAFGSGLHGWGFTLNKFAEMYSSKFGIPAEKFCKYLWGEHFFDAKNKPYKSPKSKRAGGQKLRRGFVKFILDPIYKLFDAVMDDDASRYDPILSALGVKLSTDDRVKLRGKHLLKKIMQKFLPAADALLEMIVVHLPSPRIAQAYRYETLYTGPLDDEAATGIKTCDPTGPLMLYISKMVPTSDAGRFYAFGRVFSGTVHSGQKVRILGNNYQPGEKIDLQVQNIQRTVLMMGSKVETISSCPAGNTVALVGVDRFIKKNATITNIESAHTIRAMKFSVSPVVRVAVEPKNPSDLPKLIEGMKRLGKSDPCVICTTLPSGEHIIAGAGELHLEVCLKDLREDYTGIDLVISNPVVSYKEHITEPSARPVMAKSANKHNRLYIIAEPWSLDMVKDFEIGEFRATQDVKSRAKFLSEKYEWDTNDARKIWDFGPDGNGPNCFVDATKGVQYMNEIKQHVQAAFQWASSMGSLCNEEMYGCTYKLVDAVLHQDAIHRGNGQILPTARRAILGAELLSKPVLMEPIYLVEIQCPIDVASNVYNVIGRRRGEMISDEQGTNNQTVMKAHLPVAESFGFDAALREATSGKAFPQCSYSHLKEFAQDPLEEGTQASRIMLDIRERKGLKVVIPTVGDYEDRL